MTVFRRLLFPLLLAGLVLAGCSQTGAPPAGDVFTVSGTVTEAGSETTAFPDGAPLEGVTVTLDGQSVTTGTDGGFSFPDVAAGSWEIGATLAGYDSASEGLEVDSDTGLIIRLEPSGGQVVATGELAQTLAGLDGSETDDSKVTISGNIADLELPAGPAGEMLAPGSTAITVDKLQALVNGVVYEISFDASGGFHQEVPVNPGPNTIQLRVFNEEGAAHSTEAIIVTVTFERLDLRVLLRWDTTGDSDVDIHMFQRSPSEAPPVPARGFSVWGEWWNKDRHVYFANKTPQDFGSGTTQNPFLDIDNTEGFGPETIVLQEAADGDYHVWVHFYNKGADPVTNATVDVTVNQPGAAAPVTRRFTKQLTEDWEYWYVTTVSFPDGSFRDLGLVPTSQ